MSRVCKTFITTADSGKTYEFPSDEKDGKRPDLWVLRVFVTNVDSRSGIANTNPYHTTPDAEIYLERETLQRAGRLPIKPTSPVEKTETVEDLVLRLLDMVGIRPQE